MQRLTQAEMRYLKRNYRDYDVIISAIENTCEDYLYAVADYCFYDAECVRTSENKSILYDVCENVFERYITEKRWNQ